MRRLFLFVFTVLYLLLLAWSAESEPLSEGLFAPVEDDVILRSEEPIQAGCAARKYLPAKIYVPLKNEKPIKFHLKLGTNLDDETIYYCNSRNGFCWVFDYREPCSMKLENEKIYKVEIQSAEPMDTSCEEACKITVLTYPRFFSGKTTRESQCSCWEDN